MPSRYGSSAFSGLRKACALGLLDSSWQSDKINNRAYEAMHGGSKKRGEINVKWETMYKKTPCNSRQCD